MKKEYKEKQSFSGAEKSKIFHHLEKAKGHNYTGLAEKIYIEDIVPIISTPQYNRLSKLMEVEYCSIIIKKIAQALMEAYEDGKKSK